MENGVIKLQITWNTIFLGDKCTDHIILSLPVKNPKQIMGLWHNLTENNTRQIHEITEKHKKIINNIKLSEIAQNIAWKGFIGVLWSSIRYGLPSYAIHIEKSNRIISKSFRTLFNLIGNHRNFQGAVIVLPYYFLGLSVPEPFVENDIAQIITFINNMGSEILTSKFITYTV